MPRQRLVADARLLLAERWLAHSADEQWRRWRWFSRWWWLHGHNAERVGDGAPFGAGSMAATPTLSRETHVGFCHHGKFLIHWLLQGVLPKNAKRFAADRMIDETSASPPSWFCPFGCILRRAHFLDLA
jgi:hypothetical protein